MYAFQTDPREVEADSPSVCRGASSSFRRTLVRLKLASDHQRDTHTEFQTDPREVEAARCPRRASQSATFQTDPREVEARGIARCRDDPSRFQTDPREVEAYQGIDVQTGLTLVSDGPS